MILKFYQWMEGFRWSEIMCKIRHSWEFVFAVKDGSFHQILREPHDSTKVRTTVLESQHTNIRQPRVWPEWMPILYEIRVKRGWYLQRYGIMRIRVLSFVLSKLDHRLSGNNKWNILLYLIEMNNFQKAETTQHSSWMMEGFRVVPQYFIEMVDI